MGDEARRAKVVQTTPPVTDGTPVSRPRRKSKPFPRWAVVLIAFAVLAGTGVVVSVTILNVLLTHKTERRQSPKSADEWQAMKGKTARELLDWAGRPSTADVKPEDFSGPMRWHYYGRVTNDITKGTSSVAVRIDGGKVVLVEID